MTTAPHKAHPPAPGRLATLGAGDSATELTTDWLRPHQANPMATALRAGRSAARGQLIALGAEGSARRGQAALPLTDETQA